jgi:CDP-diacylglycerol--glycerol-3-phosphate 3-phosphatidyltransferase
MLTIYSVKPYFQRALKPLLDFLIRVRITPNQITLFAVFISISFGTYFALAGRASWWLMPLVLLVRMALNALDGMLARQLQMQSHLGTYLNELGDMVSDLFLYLPFAIEFPGSIELVCFLSLFSEIAGILATAIGKKRRYDGPMGKSDRAFCLGIMGFLMAFGWINDLWAIVIFGGLSFLLFLTIFSRIKNALVGNQ